jgi:hypothetical protein
MSVQKISKIFVQTKLEDNEIEYNMSPIDIITKGSDDKKNYRFRKDIHFCMYKTTLPNNKKAIIMIFSIKIPTLTIGSSSESDTVMEIVEILENLLLPLHGWNYQKNIEGINKHVALLKVIKELENEDNE